MFTSTDERITILKMVEENKISAEQAAQLLSAMGEGKRAPVVPPMPAPIPMPATDPAPSAEVKSTGGKNARFLRVLITNTTTGKPKVSVNVPFSLVRWGMQVGARFAPEVAGFDLDELNEILQSETQGKIIDVVDDEDSEHVEIFVE